MVLIIHDAFSLHGLAADCTLLFLVASAVQAAEQLSDAPSVDARVWVLMGYVSGKVFSGDNADRKLNPVSLTKAMTGHVVGQAIKAGKIKLTDMVTVGRDVWATGSPTLRGSSMMFLRPDIQVSMEDPNKGVIIQPGNDANVAIADYMAGNQDVFASLMNGYARKMGLTNTAFMTVHGLDAPGQLSTVRDMALLTEMMTRDVPEKYAVYKGKELTFNKICQPDRNRLLWSTNLSADGMKTGTTAGAGYNLVSSTTQGDMHLIAMILGVKTDRIRSNESEKLLTQGFRFYETVTSIKPDVTFVTQRVWFGDSSEAKLGADGTGSIILPKGQLKDLRASHTLNQPQLTVPLEKGQVAGVIDFRLDDKITEQRPLIVMEPVKGGGSFSRMIDFVLTKLHGWFGS